MTNFEHDAASQSGKSKKLIDKIAVRHRLGGISDSTLWRIVGFPQPVRVTKGRVMWIESEVDAFIEARAADRNKHAA